MWMMGEKNAVDEEENVRVIQRERWSRQRRFYNVIGMVAG